MYHEVSVEDNCSTNSLAHVEGEADVFLFGEEQNQEVVTCLALLDGRIQTDLHQKTRSMCDAHKEKPCKNI